MTVWGGGDDDDDVVVGPFQRCWVAPTRGGVMTVVLLLVQIGGLGGSCLDAPGGRTRAAALVVMEGGFMVQESTASNLVKKASVSSR